MERYVRAASIVHARNLDGSVVCKAAGALPFLLREGQLAHFVPPTLRGPRQARVERVDELRSGSWVVAFAGVDSIDLAETLAGSYCLVSDEELGSISCSEEPALLAGFEVVDVVFGPLGRVEGLLQSPAQDTLDIAGAQGQLLVPYVDEFVIDVDEEARLVRTRVPEGLLRLNRKDDARDS